MEFETTLRLGGIYSTIVAINLKTSTKNAVRYIVPLVSGCGRMLLVLHLQELEPVF